MEEIRDKVVFITGGARGIGLGMARAFCRHGATVVVTDVDPDALSAATAELSELGTVTGLQLDVRDRAAFAAAADQAEHQHGPVSVVCNNAGVWWPFTVDEMSYDVWDYVLGVNLHGVINGVQTFLPRMLSRGQPAHVVNTSSLAGIVAASPERNSGYYTYAASKYAVTGLTEALHHELHASRLPIGASVLLPGSVITDISTHTIANAPETIGTSERREEWRAAAPQADDMRNRLGRSPDEAGEMVVAAVRRDDLHIFTDRLIERGLTARTAALIEAMPPASAQDRALADAIYEAARRENT